MTYRAPVKDMLFVMKELAGIDELTKLPAFEDAGYDTARAVLEPLQKTTPGLRFGGHFGLLPSSLDTSSRAGRPAGFGTLPEAGCRGFKGPVPSASLDAERDAARFRNGV